MVTEEDRKAVDRKSGAYRNWRRAKLEEEKRVVEEAFVGGVSLMAREGDRSVERRTGEGEGWKMNGREMKCGMCRRRNCGVVLGECIRWPPGGGGMKTRRILQESEGFINRSCDNVSTCRT
jgi:hypothetical protein